MMVAHGGSDGRLRAVGQVGPGGSKVLSRRAGTHFLDLGGPSCPNGARRQLCSFCTGQVRTLSSGETKETRDGTRLRSASHKSCPRQQSGSGPAVVATKQQLRTTNLRSGHLRERGPKPGRDSNQIRDTRPEHHGGTSGTGPLQCQRRVMHWRSPAVKAADRAGANSRRTAPGYRGNAPVD